MQYQNIDKLLDEINRVEINSNDIERGDLFLALSGEKRDGHEFILDTFEKGAKFSFFNKKTAQKFLSSTQIELLLDKYKNSLIEVDDAFEALLYLAKKKLERFKIRQKHKNPQSKIIAITGSSGKTTTKEMLSAIMTKAKCKILSTRGNFNNFLGMLINLASLKGDEDYLILEIGMNHLGEIAKMSDFLSPDIAIITSIGNAHIGNFNSVNEIVKAKLEILSGINLLGNDAVKIILSEDDDQKYQLTSKILAKGFHSLNILIAYDKYTEIQINKLKQQSKYKYPFQNHIYKILNIIYKLLLVIWNDDYIMVNNQINLYISLYVPLIGRGKIENIKYFHPILKKYLNYHLITDYYNSNPLALKSSIDYFEKISNLSEMSRCDKILIIGEMGELGKFSYRFHKEIIDYIFQRNFDILLLVGNEFAFIKSYQEYQKTIFHFENVSQLISKIDVFIQNDSLILAKASRSIGMEVVYSKLNK